MFEFRSVRPQYDTAFVIGLMILIILFAGVACTPVPVSETTVQEVATEPASEATGPQYGGTLTIAMGADIDNMDVQAGIGIVAYPLFAVYDPLLGISRDVELVPRLAESWELVDETTYRFRLRDGITFHSGNPFDAEAVKGSIERFQEPGVPARDYNLLSMIDSVEVEDEHTVIFNLKYPFPAFPYHTAEVLALVVDPNYAEEVGPEAYTMDPSGTGPFMMEQWDRNSQITLVRNPNYWEEGKPYLDHVVYKVIPDESTRIVALEAGEVDVVWGFAPAEVERLTNNPDIKVDEQTISRSVYLGFAFNEEPFNDIRVRQALVHAVNTDNIVNFVQEGTVEKATTFYPSFIFGSAEGQIDADLSYDPEEARALLEEAGWVDSDGDGVREKDGEPLSLTLTFPNAVLPAMRQTSEVIQQNFKEVGIELALDEREWAAFIGDWFEKNLQMYIMGVSATTGSLDVSFPNQWTTEGAWNSGLYSNPEVDELFAEASRTLDDEQRQQMYQALQQILADDIAAIPLFHMKIYVAMNSKVHGFENHPLEHVIVTNTWIEE